MNTDKKFFRIRVYPCPSVVKFFALLIACSTLHAASKSIILIAGKPSHGPGEHEFRAGSLLLQKCLDQVPGISSVVYPNGWPNVEGAFDKANAVLLYADGGAGHPAIQGEHMKIIDGLANKGVGIGCAHYAVEVPKGEPGEAMHRWIGGYYENMYSVNPSVRDEWYFNIRWPSDMKGITPILVAKPSDQVRKGPYVYPAGPYPHIVEAAGRDETMMWVYERPDGGRSFGFTGGHRHVNWGNENFRKVVLNALLWIAKADVPEGGMKCSISEEDLNANLDSKQKKK